MKYEEEIIHEEFPPNGVIKIGLSKQSRLKGVIQRYAEIGFKDFDLVELAQLSLSQWRDKKYPIPDGYKASWGNYIEKYDLKSHPFVK